VTESELRELIAGHESDRVELTVSYAKTDKFAEAVCAFANDFSQHQKPGYLVIGANDDGEIVGASVDDRLLLTLADLRSNGNIQPLPEIVVEKVQVSGGKSVAVVTVQPAALPPLRYHGRVCIRIGPSRRYATEQEERRLVERRVSHARTFDAQPCLGSTIDSLSRALFLVEYRPLVVDAEVIAENHRSLEYQMASLRFFDSNLNCPTNAGVLLFGLDSRYFLPGAYVQFLRVSGTSLAGSIENEREISGDLRSVLRELDLTLDAQISQTPVSDGLLRDRLVEAYPRIALRELVMNGILHRDYASTAPLRISWFDDRIEIQSPGGLFGDVSRENFPNQTGYRNPIIAEALKAWGYVNRYGRGVIRAQEALRKNGNPEPEFDFEFGYVLATIRTAS